MYMNWAESTITSFLGTGLILLSALTASLNNVLARKLTQRYSIFTITYCMTLFGFIAFNGLALTNKCNRRNSPSIYGAFWTLGFRSCHFIFRYLIVFSNVLSFQLCFIKNRRIKNECSVILLNSLPF